MNTPIKGPVRVALKLVRVQWRGKQIALTVIRDLRDETIVMFAGRNKAVWIRDAINEKLERDKT